LLAIFKHCGYFVFLKIRAGNVAQVVNYLSCKLKALSSNPRTAKKKKEKLDFITIKTFHLETWLKC
jgi:hypothetical protein